MKGLRLFVHDVLLRLDYRWGYLPIFRWWLPQLVDRSCPNWRTPQRCPFFPDEDEAS